MTRALGIGDDDRLDSWLLPAERGQRLLVCSDSITEVVSADDLPAVVLREASVSQASNRLVELALDRGGPDNVSVIVVEVDAVSRSDSGLEATGPLIDTNRGIDSMNDIETDFEGTAEQRRAIVTDSAVVVLVADATDADARALQRLLDQDDAEALDASDLVAAVLPLQEPLRQTPTTPPVEPAKPAEPVQAEVRSRRLVAGPPPAASARPPRALRPKMTPPR